MAPTVSPRTEVKVKVLCGQGCSGSVIKKRLFCDGKIISLSTIRRIKCDEGKKREFFQKGEPVTPRNRKPRKLTKSVLHKIDTLTSKSDPPSQVSMANSLKVCRKTIYNAIKNKLHKVTRIKPKVHVLNESHIQNRKTNARKLYREHLAGTKGEFSVTLDEAFFYVQDCATGSDICYVRKGETLPSDWLKVKRESFAEKMMVVGCMTGRGVLPLVFVPPNVKINAEYYIDYVLKPLLEDGVPSLYGEDTSKVFVHHDAATSHTANKTRDYADQLHQKLGITLISKKEIPVKSPDGSPLDFFGFGYLKQKLKARRAKTLDGLRKVLVDEWSKITPTDCENVFKAWKRRLRMISETGGHHIEQTKKIHKRKL